MEQTAHKRLSHAAAIRLPLRFDASPLAKEVDSVDKIQWASHFVKIHYDTGWQGLGLRTRNGDPMDLEAGPAYSDTPFLELCPRIASVLDEFKCEKRRVRLLRLKEGASIKEHIDLRTGSGFDEVRLHVPIITNPDVEFYAAGERVIMREGECWYLDASYPHKLFNGGSHARTHLVIDCEVNDWVRSLFSTGFFDASLRKTISYKWRVLVYVGWDVYRASLSGDRVERTRRSRLLFKELGMTDLAKRFLGGRRRLKNLW